MVVEQDYECEGIIVKTLNGWFKLLPSLLQIISALRRTDQCVGR